MARTLEANAPNSLSAFTVKVIVGGAVTETITMAHVALEPGTWRGTIAQAGSVGEAKLSYYWNGGTVEAGVFFADISATDGTTSYARDFSIVQWPPRNATATVNLTGTSVKLTSDGLDAISIAAPSGVASNFREMIVQLWRRFFKKATKSSTQIKTYADNGTTVLTTQTISSTGQNETQGQATS